MSSLHRMGFLRTSSTGPAWQMGPCSAMPGPLGHKAPRFQSAAPSMKKKIQVCPMSEATQDIHFPERKIQIHRYCPFLTKVVEVSLCGVQKRRKGVTKAIWPKPSLRRWCGWLRNRASLPSTTTSHLISWDSARSSTALKLRPLFLDFNDNNSSQLTHGPSFKAVILWPCHSLFLEMLIQHPWKGHTLYY